MGEYLIGGALIFIGFAMHRIADAIYDAGEAARQIAYRLSDVDTKT